MINPYENLANAIVVQAAKDYLTALKKLKKDPNDEQSVYTRDDCERFFRSPWYRGLTKVDGEYLMRKLRKEAGV